MNWGNRDIRTTTEIIVAAEADIVCIQESNRDFERYLERTLKGTYPTMVFRGAGGKFPAERFGILLKSHVNEETLLPAKHGIFGTQIVELRVGNEVVQVANVHLEPIRPPEKSEILKVFEVFQTVEAIHAAEMRWLTEHLSPTLPTVVAGDFNSLSGGAAPKYLIDRGFMDSFASVTDSPDSHPTWRWPTRIFDFVGRIDYIFHSRHFTTRESRISERLASDHALVVSKLEWSDDED